MRKEDNREKYKEYDHRYYIKHRRPNSKIGKLETKISDLEAKLAESEHRNEQLVDALNGEVFINYKLPMENAQLKQQLGEKEKEIEARDKRIDILEENYYQETRNLEWVNEQLTEAEKQLEEKEKKIRQLDNEKGMLLNNSMKLLKEKDDKLKSQPAEIVRKISGEIYTRMVVECKETKYTDINLILNTIFKEYQK